MRIGQTSFVVFGSKLIASAIGFLATVYFARVLGAEVYGYYAIVLALAAWLKLGGTLGVSSAVIKRISEGEERSAYFSAGVIAVATFGAIICVLVLLLHEYVDAYVGVEVATFVVLLVGAGLFASIVKAALEGQRLVHVSGLLSPVETALRSAIQIGLVILGFELAGMLVGYAAGGLLIGVVGLAFVSVRLQRPHLEHFWSLYDYAKYAWLGGMKSRSFNDVDIVVLGALVQPWYVGVYAVAWTIAQFLSLFGDAMKKSMFPEISRADSDDRYRLIETLITDSITYAGLIVIPGLFGAAVIGDRLLQIYGDEFVHGTTVLVLLIAAYLIYSYQKQFMNAINALDRPDIAFRINLVFIASNAILNVLLIVWIGWLGAAIATVLAAAIGLGLSYHHLRRLTTFSLPIGELLRQTVSAAGMALIVAIGREIVETTNLIQHNVAIVLLLVSLGAGTYFLFLLAISSDFRTTVVANSPIRIRLGS